MPNRLRHPGLSSLIIAAACLGGLRPAAAAQSAVAVEATSDTIPRPPITVSPGFSAAAYVARSEPIELTFNRLPERDEGSIAIMLETTDITALFERHGTRLRYLAKPFPLPSGEHEVVVHLVSARGWSELARLPIRVLTSQGLERATLQGSAAVNTSGLIADGQRGDAAPEAGPQFRDIQLTLGLQTVHARSAWTVESRENVLGVTKREQALRFGELGEDAPAVDLSDYAIAIERAGTRLTIGNSTIAGTRHLISSFGSRGITLAMNRGPASLSLGVLGGSSVVGWSDLLGFSRPSHRVSGASVGFEVLPRTPGALRIDLSTVNGSLQPRTGFTQAALTDAERSSGYGLQVTASTPTQRFRMTGGISNSRFVNPADPLLSGGETTVPVAPARKTARYLESSLGLLQNARLFGVSTNMTIGWQHERVDPLYRSIAAPTRADILSNAFSTTAQIGVVSLQASHARSTDNLARVPSILRTLTRSTGLNAAMPLASLFRVRAPGPLWPSATVGFSTHRQFGAGVPINSGFTAADVPDQVSTVRDLGLQWQGNGWRAGYQWNRSLQDNRQAGREQSDAGTTAQAIGAGVTVWRVLDVGLDLASERQENRELASETRLDRLGVNGTWRPGALTSIGSQFSTTVSADEPRTQRNNTTELRLELTQGIALWTRAGQANRGQFFTRFSRQAGATRTAVEAAVPGSRVSRAAWTLVSGMNLTLF